MLRICLVGAGDWATARHGPALAHLVTEHPGELILAGVCEPRGIAQGEAFCRQFGFQRAYTKLDEMLEAERPDACWCITPITATCKVASRLLEAGIPVLLEKPPGANVREAQELVAIAQRTGTPNMVALNRRWAPSTRQAMEWASRHAPIEHIHARMLRTGRRDEEFAFGTGIHLLDCVRTLGEASGGKLLSSRCERIRSATGVWRFHVDLTFTSGLTARGDLLPTCGVLEESYTLYGADQTIACELPENNHPGRAELTSKGAIQESATWPAQPLFLSSGIYSEAEEFITALQEKRQPSPSVAEALTSVMLAEAVQEGRDITFV